MAAPPPSGRSSNEQEHTGPLDRLILGLFSALPKAFTLPWAIFTRHHVGGAYYGFSTVFCQLVIFWLTGWGLSESGWLPSLDRTDVRQVLIPAGLWLLSWLNLVVIKVQWERQRRRGRHVVSSYPGELRFLPTNAGTRIFVLPLLLCATGAAATVGLGRVAPWFVLGPFVILAGVGALWEGAAFWLYCRSLEVKTGDAQAMAEGIGSTGQRVAAWQVQEATARQTRKARRAEERRPTPANARAGNDEPDAVALMRRFSSQKERE